MAHHSTEAIQQMQNRGIPYHHSGTPLLTLLHSLTLQNTIISLTEITFTGGHTRNFPSVLSSFHHLCYTILTILFYDYVLVTVGYIHKKRHNVFCIAWLCLYINHDRVLGNEERVSVYITRVTSVFVCTQRR